MSHTILRHQCICSLYTAASAPKIDLFLLFEAQAPYCVESWLSNEHYERIDIVAPNFHLSACIEFQKSLFVRLTTDKNSEKFFKVFFERMTNAQNEIKSTVVPNTGDVMSRSTWNKSAHKEIEAPGLSSISASFVYQVSVLVHF